MKRIVVSGGFDPIHAGHVAHIEKAKRHGDHLTVIVSSDEQLIKKKGYCFLPLEHRLAIIKALRSVDEVIVCYDDDGTCTTALKMLRPDVFCKGGDRTPNNMPQSEIDICQEIGCQIVYGVGEKVASSQDLIQAAIKQLKEI